MAGESDRGPVSHRIRIAGHWQRTAAGWRRSFGRPTAGTKFRLSGVANAAGICQVNGTIVGVLETGRAFEFDISHLLNHRNSLDFPDGAEPGELALQIDG
jgi:hypothetical protein